MTKRMDIALSVLLLACSSEGDPDGAAGSATASGAGGSLVAAGGSAGSGEAGSGAGGSDQGGAGGSGRGGGGGEPSTCAPSGIQVGPVKVSDESLAYYPAILRAGADTLAVAWQHYYQQSTSDLRMRLIDRESLAPLPEDPITVSSGALYSVGSIRLAPAPDGFGLSYARSYYTTGETICRAAMYDTSAAMVGQTFNAASGAGCSHPSMVHDGVDWGYFFLNGSGIAMRWLEPDGDPLSGQLVDGVAGGNGAVVGFNPTDQLYVVAYTQGFADGGTEIVTAHMDVTGTVLAEAVRISHAPEESRFPEMIWNGVGFGVVWDDNRSGTFETYFAALDGTGAPIGDEVPVVTTGYGAAIAWSGDHYGLAWRTFDDEVHFKAIDSSGTQVGSEVTISIDVAQHSRNPSITWDGARFVVAWFENTQGVQTEEVFVAAVCP